MRFPWWFPANSIPKRQTKVHVSSMAFNQPFQKKQDNIPLFYGMVYESTPCLLATSISNLSKNRLNNMILILASEKGLTKPVKPHETTPKEQMLDNLYVSYNATFKTIQKLIHPAHSQFTSNENTKKVRRSNNNPLAEPQFQNTNKIDKQIRKLLSKQNLKKLEKHH